MAEGEEGGVDEAKEEGDGARDEEHQDGTVAILVDMSGLLMQGSMQER